MVIGREPRNWTLTWRFKAACATITLVPYTFDAKIQSTIWGLNPYLLLGRQLYYRYTNGALNAFHRIRTYTLHVLSVLSLPNWIRKARVATFLALLVKLRNAQGRFCADQALPRDGRPRWSKRQG